MKKQSRILILTISCLLFIGASVWASDRGIIPLLIKDKSGKQIGLYKESHALLIGVSEYSAGWPKLPGVLGDIREIQAALEGHGFNVVVVKNPNREQLEKAFNDFINKYGRGKDNRLLLYFAGHGHTLKMAYGAEMGYIVPADAPDVNKDEAGFLAKALSMNQMEVYARNIQSKHAVFIFDSCFSGSLFAMTRAIPQVIQEKTNLPVRQFITAGTANQEVPDESLFHKMFIKALQGDADMNKDGYVTGTELGQYLEDMVTNYSKRSQTPRYGKLRDPILDQGDFVFTLQNVSEPDILTGKNPIDEEHKILEAKKQLSEERKKLEEERLKLVREQEQMAKLESSKPYDKNESSVTPGMVRIPKGVFLFGLPDLPKSIALNEFYIDKLPVTQAEYEKVMKSNPSNSKGGNLPVERVTWFEADRYCKKLGKRLPTEWEWEKAAQGGSEPTYASIDEGGKLSESELNDKIADYHSHAVGESKPNGYGVHDMTGNVWEWTANDYENSGKYKILHGGSRGATPGDSRPVHRFSPIPGMRYSFYGFRCAL